MAVFSTTREVDRKREMCFTGGHRTGGGIATLLADTRVWLSSVLPERLIERDRCASQVAIEQVKGLGR